MTFTHQMVRPQLVDKLWTDRPRVGDKHPSAPSVRCCSSTYKSTTPSHPLTAPSIWALLTNRQHIFVLVYKWSGFSYFLIYRHKYFILSTVWNHFLKKWIFSCSYALCYTHYPQLWYLLIIYRKNIEISESRKEKLKQKGYKYSRVESIRLIQIGSFKNDWRFGYGK